MSIINKTASNLNAIMIINNITTITSKDPEDILDPEKDCLSKYASFIFEEGAIFCNTTFDTYLCWPPTKANTVIQQNCPKVHLSDPSRFAYRKCGYKGLWEGRRPNEANLKGWTNFTPCFSPDIQTLFVEVFNDNDTQTKFQIAENTRILEIVGYTLSLVSIVIAIIIFCCFKSILNKRFQLHKCLFTAMLAQTFIHVTLYLDQAFNPINDSAAQFSGNRGIYNTPILCEALYILMEMSITATFTWIFLEGIYLNFLVSKYALQSSLDLKLYFIFGWGFPCILTFIWAIINWKYYKDEKIKTCWFGYNFAASYWCLQGPRLIIIIVNIVILCRVMRTVISKLRAHKTSEVVRIKKSVKAALLLLPLLGVTNLLSTFDIPITTTLWIFRIWCYTRQFFKSFQGFFLSVIYCFCNEEVRSVLTRRYNNSRRIGRFGRDQNSKQNLRRSAARQDVDRPQQPTTSGLAVESSDTDSDIEKKMANKNTTIIEETSFTDANTK